MNLLHSDTSKAFPVSLAPDAEALARAPEVSFDAGIALLLPDLRRRARGLARTVERAEDLVQDTIERALRFRDSFRSGSQLRAWLMRILHNVFVSQHRRVVTERRILEGARVDPNGWARDRPTLLLPGLSPNVAAAMDSLPEHLREVVRLVDLEERSYRDAAEFAQVPVGTVMSRLHRGRARLAAALAEPVASDESSASAGISASQAEAA